ncbi:MAG: hypothetical protein JO149_01975, partial [Gammaproteobacteria bacterium]|nr:hypothetical protein [Gammaproteobacteria bacterium]
MAQARTTEIRSNEVILSVNALPIAKKFLALEEIVSSFVFPEFIYLTAKNVPAILKAAIYYGWLDIIRYMLEEKKYSIASIKSMLAREAAYQGRIKILEYFINHQHVIPSIVLFQIASKGGQVSLIRWLREIYHFQLIVPDHDDCWHKNYFIWMLKKGYLEVLKWLVKEENFNLNKLHAEYNLIMITCNYEHWHILEWLVRVGIPLKNIGKASDKILKNIVRYMSDFTYDRDSLARYLYHANGNSWSLLYKFFKMATLKPFNLRVHTQWLIWLKEKYELALLSENHIDKEKITYQYNRLCYLPTVNISLLNNLSRDTLQHVCNFLAPLDIFSSLQFTSRRYYYFVQNPQFIANKYQQYFFIDRENITYQAFIKTYLNNFKPINRKDKNAIHACLTDNLAYSTNISFKLLTNYYTGDDFAKSFYSFLIKKPHCVAINYFVQHSIKSQLPST